MKQSSAAEVYTSAYGLASTAISLIEMLFKHWSVIFGLNTAINTVFVGRRYTTRPAAPTTVKW